MLKICRAIENPLIELKSLICNNKGAIRCSSIASKAIEEKKIRVKDVDINYAKTGDGEHPVLLLPGFLGTIWLDFKEHMEAFDRKKFTIVGWDPPGHGKSRPPDKTYPDDFLYIDADYAYQLMKNLGFSRFSLIGYSSGSVTALIMAANNPESINKLVTSGGRSYVSHRESEIYKSLENIDNWSKWMRDTRLNAYDEDYLRKTWSACVKAFVDISKKQNGDICRDLLKKIKCPTLIVHGTKDPMLDREQPEYLLKHISNSRLELFEGGGHHVHQDHHEKFNRLVTEFLLENS